MSHRSRPQSLGPARRRRHDLKLDAVTPLEERSLLAPVVSVYPRLAAFSPVANPPQGVIAGGVVVTLGQQDAGFPSAAPLTSVTQLTPITSFGGDIVRIEAGPGGDFGKGVYAISRGGGANDLPANDPALATALPRTVTDAANRPGVIYRVDPATGRSSVFFDLNTVVNQLDPSATPGNSVGSASGLVNWYDIAFDSEGYFDGRPSMFVASVDRSNAAKNAVYRIAPDGTFMGMFAQFTDGQSALKFDFNPTAVVVPGAENQQFLRGLFAGDGVASGSTFTGEFTALYFDANAYAPGQVISNLDSLPTGVRSTGFTLGPIVGLTTANQDYLSRVYSAFTDFGTPPAGGIPGNPGLSGVQGVNGELPINGGLFPVNSNTSTDSTIGDRFPVATTDFRRFQDIAFDQYGYFSQGVNIGTATGGGTGTGTGSTVGTGAGGGTGDGVGQTLGIAGAPGTVVIDSTATTVALPPAYRGSLFVADLGTGLSLPFTPSATAIDGTAITPAPGTFRLPVQGPETVTLTTLPNGTVNTQVNPGTGLGGRLVSITPSGTVINYAENFNTTNILDSRGFELSSLSVTFSADGTTMYVADNDAIWQFKTVASLAGSTTGSLIGLNDLRSLGVPYEGQDSAVAVLDTGIDANSTPFRGRVAGGSNVYINNGLLGNDDYANFGTAGTTGGTGGGGGGGGGTGGGSNLAPATTADGHGTPVAGIIAQFVPQATLVPINAFAPFQAGVTLTGGGGGTGGGGTTTANSNALTSNQAIYQGFNYITKNPFVNDPIRPGKVDRVIASVMGWGTTSTFDAEGSAYRKYPQLVIALKNELRKFRHLGIAPFAAAGQFGAPVGATAGTGTGTASGGAANSAQNQNVGDVNGMSLPAVLNEVVSVSGSYPFPFATGPSALPTNPPVGVIPRPGGPILTFGNNVTIGGNGTGTGGGTGTGTYNPLANILANADLVIYTDRILGASNRSRTTDFVAPALDVPTFRRTFDSTTGTTGGTGGGGTGGGGGGATFTATGDPANRMTFEFGGTSASSAIATGSYAVVSSALGFWANQNVTGAIVDAYLTQPVGLNQLNYGPHAFKDMTAYNTPDGINSILQWTAVPADDPNDGLSASGPPNAIGSDTFRNFSRVSLSNAIAAIEGQVALQWLIDHDKLGIIDVNNNGIITSTELQVFVDNAATTGNAEAGAMARLLGGTARPSAPLAANTTADPLASFSIDAASAGTATHGLTLFNEQPDQPDVLQRRFNFFDYAADGQLNGSVTIEQLKQLSHTLLPTPDAFAINDRQRSSANGWLLDPEAQRNYTDLQSILPQYEFVPRSALLRYRNISPARFKIDRGLQPGTTFPVFTLFDGANRRSNRRTPNAAANPAGATSAATTPVNTTPVNTTPAATTPTDTTVTSTIDTATGTATPINVTSTTPQLPQGVVSQAQAAVAAAASNTTTSTPAPITFTPVTTRNGSSYASSLRQNTQVANTGILQSLTNSLKRMFS